MRCFPSAFCFIVLSLFLLTSCGKDNGGNQSPVNSSPMSGNVYGATWSFGGAEALTYASEGGKLTIRIWNSAEHKPCALGFLGKDRGVDFSITPQTGDYDVSSASKDPLMFYESEPNSWDGTSTDSGAVHITSITNDTIQGSIVASDGKNSVNGTFTATICH